MPDTGLRGSYTLDNETIEEKVTETSAGPRHEKRYSCTNPKPSSPVI